MASLCYAGVSLPSACVGLDVNIFLLSRSWHEQTMIMIQSFWCKALHLQPRNKPQRSINIIFFGPACGQARKL